MALGGFNRKLLSLSIFIFQTWTWVAKKKLWALLQATSFI